MLLPTLLDWLSDTPIRTAACWLTAGSVEALSDQRWFLVHAARRERGGQRLMRVLGTSAFVPDLLMRARGDPAGTPTGPPARSCSDVDPDGVAKALVASAGRHADRAGHRGCPHPAPARTRQGRLRPTCSGMLDVRDVCKRTDFGVGGGAAVAPGAVIRANTPAGTAPATIAGDRDGPARRAANSGYGSDADVMFVCDPAEGADETTAVKWSVSIAEQVRALLGTPSDDPPLEVDANLRPEGRNGPLVRTLASYSNYYGQWAQPWERSRHCCEPARWPGTMTWAMRSWRWPTRIRYPQGGISPRRGRRSGGSRPGGRRAAAARRGSQHPHTKLGRGGLADVE